jgi:NAD(P)-dependent dehydrogenase (short-subunit alcohol dehydrogenase family)
MFDLSNKHVLITGATGYLGREISHGLAKMGATIHVNSRKKDACLTLVDDIRANGFNAICASFDVMNEEAVIAYANSIDLLDVLINNSYSGAGGTMLSSSSAEYINSYNSSVVASANLIKMLESKFTKAVTLNGYASIINIASMYGMVSPDLRIYDTIESASPPFYGAAKAALIQLTKYAACEFAKRNIRVNCISPGPFPSKQAQSELPKMFRQIISKVPMGRIGIPSELLGPIAFLASDASSYVTGINIPVDGGWTSW